MDTTGGRAARSRDDDGLRSGASRNDPGGRLNNRELRVVAAVFGGGLVVAVAVVVIGALSAEPSFDFGAELAKAGVGLGTATLIGAGVAYVLRRVEERRGDERLQAEYRSELFVGLVGAYNAVKLERRAMRAHGYTLAAADRELTQEDADCFNAQMRSLTEAQLRFEQTHREIKARAHWVPDAPEVLKELQQVEGYVNSIVNQWEESDGRIRAGAHLRDIHDLSLLQDFLGKGSEDFSEQIAKPLTRVEDLLRPREHRRRPL